MLTVTQLGLVVFGCSDSNDSRGQKLSSMLLDNICKYHLCCCQHSHHDFGSPSHHQMRVPPSHLHLPTEAGAWHKSARCSSKAWSAVNVVHSFVVWSRHYLAAHRHVAHGAVLALNAAECPVQCNSHLLALVHCVVCASGALDIVSNQSSSQARHFLTISHHPASSPATTPAATCSSTLTTLTVTPHESD